MRFHKGPIAVGRNQNHVMGGATRHACALMLACLATCVVLAATTSDLCGATILEDLKLDDDLTCTGDGLIVGADGIRIDLNGYTLSGSGVGAGMVVTGRSNVSISGGTVRNFAVALRVNTSTDLVVKHMEFVANLEGIDLQSGSIGNTIKDSAFRDSTTRGIMLRGDSRENDIKNNTFTGNRIGILVFGGIDNTLKQNIVSGSTLVGIRLNVIATGNDLKDNTITSNFVGIEFLVTPTGSAAGNDLKGNTIVTNDCGLKGPTAGNDMKNNFFDGNGADTCS